MGSVRYKWYGTQVQQKVGEVVGQRVRAAGAFLRDAIKEDVSIDNVGGREPSLPGESPRMNTGSFRDSITFTYQIGATPLRSKAKVGSTDPRAIWFEKGTSRMRPRPWLTNGLKNHASAVAAILAGNGR